MWAGLVRRMHCDRTLFAQVMSFLLWTTLARIVARYDGDRFVRSLRCTDQYRAMASAQLTRREGLRDIEDCLAARPSSTIPASTHRSAARPSPMPTGAAIGASIPISASD